MSHPLAPRPSEGPTGGGSLTPPAQRAKKISTACLACKQRKTKCSGGAPCEACAQRSTGCNYDASSDQRRKIANQKNVHDLVMAQENLERHQQLLGGVIATLQVGENDDTSDLIRQIRSGANLSQLAAHVRNAVRSNISIQEVYDSIDFVIDGVEDEHELPSPRQILHDMQSIDASLSEPSSASGSSGLTKVTMWEKSRA